MDLAGDRYGPNSVETVFRDFKSRRAALARALTTDVASFYQQCDPERENLCLYGFPNEKWEVNLPAEEVPPELPEPALGINFARDGMAEKDWLSLVSVHSDSWLMSVAFFFAARYGLDKNDRKRLFALINDLPTLYEVVNGNNQARVAVTSHSGSKSTVTSHSGSKSKTNSKVPRASENPIPAKYAKVVKPKEEEEEDENENEGEEEEEEDEHEDTLCGACGENYATDEFWICCDLCEKWFHGRCVKITPAKAEHIKQYKCPSCSSTKRTRVN